jgi:UDPglucose--hexose-1-phosphate uridylyltransferase
MDDDIRTDEFLGTRVHVVAARQNRPITTSTDNDCPFCVGGREAPEPYDVRAFANRWPSLENGECEVVLYSPQHDATFASLGSTGARKVIDVWAERTTALRALDNVEYVVVFENRGAEIGATISHPHGQIYAFPHVPSRPERLLQAGWSPDLAPGDRLVAENDHFIAYAQFASVHPVSLIVAPRVRTADIPSLSSEQRGALASIMIDVFTRLDQLFDAPLPYMMWFLQAPAHVTTDVWMNLEIVSPWRAPHLQRYIAGVEIATEEYFNPVDPANLAARLRTLS